MKLLLTGFEPFGIHNINPSEEVVKRLGQTGIPGVDLATAVLPVDRYQGPNTLMQAIEHNQPDAIICLGEAGRRLAISIERIGINLLNFRIADNAGHQIQDTPIIPDAPAAYFTTLPVRAMMEAVQEKGIPAELSLSAGAFLCNQVTYEVLHYLHQNQLNIPAGFIHLPLLPQQAVLQTPFLPSMSLETMCEGVLAATTVL